MDFAGVQKSVLAHAASEPVVRWKSPRRGQRPRMSQPGTILQRISAGDAAAVRACLDEYGSTVWSIAQRYLGPLGEDVEDAVQEIFVEVWKSAVRFDPAKGSEAAFIATIAHRRLITRQQRAQRRRTAALANVPEPAAGPRTREASALRDEARAAAAAFERLSEDEKHVLHLSVHYGLSHERIAKATDLPVGTVKSRLRRGLIRLREMLHAEHEPGHAPHTAARAEGGAA